MPKFGSGIRMASIPLAQTVITFSPESGDSPNPGPGPSPGPSTSGGSGGALVGLLGLLLALGLAGAARDDESAPTAAVPPGNTQSAYVLVVPPEAAPAAVSRYLRGGLVP